VLAARRRGAIDPCTVASLRRARSDLPARVTAPASGLFLEKVYYEGDQPQGPPETFMRL
jgi:hypothetical protein